VQELCGSRIEKLEVSALVVERPLPRVECVPGQLALLSFVQMRLLDFISKICIRLLGDVVSSRIPLPVQQWPEVLVVCEGAQFRVRLVQPHQPLLGLVAPVDGLQAAQAIFIETITEDVVIRAQPHLIRSVTL